MINLTYILNFLTGCYVFEITFISIYTLFYYNFAYEPVIKCAGAGSKTS